MFEVRSGRTRNRPVGTLLSQHCSLCRRVSGGTVWQRRKRQYRGSYRSDLLVRVGGPNAGHKVFAQPMPEAYFHLPSGSGRAPKAKLLLGAGAVIFIPKLLTEIAQN